jgi:hypothetical protein
LLAAWKAGAGGLLGFLWPPERVLGQDGGRTQRLDARPPSSGGGFGLDVLHQRRDTGAPLLFRQVFPAGQRIELQHLPSRVLETVKLLPAAAGRVLLGAVEPEPFQDLAFEQCPDGVHPGPIPGPE